MCNRQSNASANEGTQAECYLCGQRTINMFEEDERVFCERCYRVKHREQGADMFVPPPNYDIEEVGRQ